MRAKTAFEFPKGYAHARENALVSAYLIVTELLCLTSRDVVERDQVLSFLLDQICRIARGSRPDEDAMVTAALGEFAGGFPAQN